MLSPHCYVNAVNLSVPEEVDAKLTKELLDKYDLKAAGSLVSNILPHIHTIKYGQAGCYSGVLQSLEGEKDTWPATTFHGLSMSACAGPGPFPSNRHLQQR